ncbi:hypothetical protein FHW03_004676 [Ochrobactrum sp. RH2CCR150]|nr:hypothetical protein [Ochrobactrum sp. RH2CCR150]
MSRFSTGFVANMIRTRFDAKIMPAPRMPARRPRFRCAGTTQSRVSAIRLQSLTRKCRQSISHTTHNDDSERVLNGFIGLGDPLIALGTLPQNHSIPQPFQVGRGLVPSGFGRTRHAEHRLAYSGGL